MAVLVTGAVAVSGARGAADPETCPTTCDRIPNSAWIDPSAVPLNAVYGWPGPAAGAAAPGPNPTLRFEELCGSTAGRDDPRSYVVAARAEVGKPEGQWQLRAQILHWRGETWQGGQLAAGLINQARTELRDCQRGAPDSSPSLTTDRPGRLAAVISGPTIMHTYLVAHPQSSTVSELTLWSAAPPQVPWPAIDDTEILDALTRPLCTAYIGSCGLPAPR